MTARLIDEVKLKAESSFNSKQTTAAGSEKSSKNIRQQATASKSSRCC
jgi:hypothetical protein